jgi:hypothetical protein
VIGWASRRYVDSKELRVPSVASTPQVSSSVVHAVDVGLLLPESSTAPTAARPRVDATRKPTAAETPTTHIRLYDRATRAARAREALPDLFQLAPGPAGYLPTLRNPCWRGRYKDNNGKGPGTEATESLMCLPKFHIIGHVKGGTSDLWQYISKHPNVNPGRVLKEQHYYSRPWLSAHQFVSRYRRWVTRALLDLCLAFHTLEVLLDLYLAFQRRFTERRQRRRRRGIRRPANCDVARVGCRYHDLTDSRQRSAAGIGPIWSRLPVTLPPI